MTIQPTKYPPCLPVSTPYFRAVEPKDSRHLVLHQRSYVFFPDIPVWPHDPFTLPTPRQQMSMDGWVISVRLSRHYCQMCCVVVRVGKWFEGVWNNEVSTGLGHARLQYTETKQEQYTFKKVYPKTLLNTILTLLEALSQDIFKVHKQIVHKYAPLLIARYLLK